MKIVKILMLAMVVSSFLAVSIPSVAAVEENKIITDSVGDVIDYLGEVVEEHPDIDVDNIDITKLTYDREDKSVTLTLKVEGIIDNRGNISDFGYFGFGTEPTEEIFDLDIDTIGYTLVLFTSYEEYQIIYVNESCQLMYGSTFEIINLSKGDFSVAIDTLTVSFEVNTTNETYDSLLAQTNYMKLKFNYSEWLEMDEEELEGLDDLMTILTDEAPNQPLQAYGEGTNLGEVGKEVEFEGFASNGQPPYTYQWDFGDGSESDEKSPTHIYDEPGEYEYTLTVTDFSGASVSDSGTIEITGESEGDEGPPIIIFVAIIVIIAVVGIIAVVYIIRR